MKITVKLNRREYSNGLKVCSTKQEKVKNGFHLSEKWYWVNASTHDKIQVLKKKNWKSRRVGDIQFGDKESAYMLCYWANCIWSRTYYKVEIRIEAFGAWSLDWGNQLKEFKLEIVGKEMIEPIRYFKLEENIL